MSNKEENMISKKVVVDRDEYEEMVYGDAKDKYETLLDLAFRRQMELLALGLYSSNEYSHLEKIKIWLRKKLEQ